MKNENMDDKNASSQFESSIDPKDHAKEMYEKKYGCKLIKWAELSNNPFDANFAQKLKNLARYGNVDSLMLISKPINNENWTRVNFYTNDNLYSIVVHWKDKIKDSYLGCTVTARKSRPGETWTRGNDLPDGKYNDKTWDNILHGIIKYELKTLQL